ncbi:adenosylcobinamide-phosphate synthase CbiB [Thalassorhabdomicrobium marinisediminis]|uniref:adenosylcobinamide-phosphate synthase CbiB n=1 Tax=Thalassorhabdomicrobium marinisediminis TaxID=2170577 RepID=UPI0024923516|nr:adenosylcobinamide-phosphate synthase CbiB [Thalassorhabdomicrobium marinisediminis]
MAVLLAMLLDALLGEPRWLWSRAPHPAVLMGRMVSFLDGRLNKGTRASGVVAVLLLVLVAVGLGALLAAVPGWWVEVIVGAMLLAQRSLAEHVARVADALRLSLGDARRAVAMIVGRDVRDMDGPAVARSAIESAAENLSDGVIAPVFWFVLAGLPGLLTYKIINTADSMIGYRTPRYEAFGRAAARLDDALNWVPARLTAALIWAVSGGAASWGAIARDAALHRSPNAGWPEAAMAPALDVALSGPRSYDGHMQDFPWVHARGRKDAGADDIDRAVGLLWRVWALALLGIALLVAIG